MKASHKFPGERRLYMQQRSQKKFTCISKKYSKVHNYTSGHDRASFDIGNHSTRSEPSSALVTISVVNTKDTIQAYKQVHSGNEVDERRVHVRFEHAAEQLCLKRHGQIQTPISPRLKIKI